MWFFKLEVRSITLLGLDKAFSFIFTLGVIIQAILSICPERDTQSTSLVISTCECYATSYLGLRLLDSSIRRTRDAYSIFMLCVHNWKPPGASMPIILDTYVILPMIAATLYGCIGWFEDSKYSTVAIVGTYFYWLLLWMRFILSIGKLSPELSEIKCQPRSRERPKKMKNRKIRKVSVPCYRKHHRLCLRQLDEMKKRRSKVILVMSSSLDRMYFVLGGFD